jgi:hypothetical protein
VELVLKVQINALPFRLAWIVSAFEGLTVAILPYVATLRPEEPIAKPPESGLLLGYIGMLTAILAVNALGGRVAPARIAGRALKIHSPLVISIWGGIFLALVFFFQSVFSFSAHTVFSTMLRAACALAASTLIVLLLYRWSANRCRALAIRFTLGSVTERVVRTSIWPLVVFVSLYEAIALPVIELVRQIEHYRFLAGLFLGSVAGATATAVVIVIYNVVSRSYPGVRLHLIVEPDD